MIGPTCESRSSSPFNMIVPPSFISWIIFDFSWRMPSRVLKNSRCATPILVMTQISGLATEERRRISPKWLTPISRMAT